MSIPQLNSTQTTEMPTAVDERTRLTLDAPFTAVSIGKVTWLSTSTGAMPWASVMIVTVGAVRSGNTSTGIRRAVYTPIAVSTNASAIITARLQRDQRITESIMALTSQWACPCAGIAADTDARRMA